MNFPVGHRKLAQLAAIKVAGQLVNSLFKHPEIKGFKREIMRQILKPKNKTKPILKEIVDAIGLPESLKSKVHTLVSQMFLHAIKSYEKWACNHPLYSVEDFENIVWENLIFKGTGEIDLQEMVAVAFNYVVNRQRSNLIADFDLACDLYLEDQVKGIFQRMSGEEKREVCKGSDISVFVSFWHDLVCCDRRIDMEKCEHLFHRCQSDTKDFFGTYYFWRKLSDERKKKVAVICFNYATSMKIPSLVLESYKYIEDGNYLANIPSITSLEILLCFLQWPYQEQFIHTMQFLHGYIAMYNSITCNFLVSNAVILFRLELSYALGESWKAFSLEYRRWLLKEHEVFQMFFKLLLQQLLSVGDNKSYWFFFSEARELLKDVLDDEEFMKRLVNVQPVRY